MRLTARPLAAALLVLLAALLLTLAPGAARAEGARPELAPAHSVIRAEGRDRGRPRPLELRLAIGAEAPYRAYLLDAPPRLVVEVQGMALPPAGTVLPGQELVAALRWGPGLPGWARVVVELSGPYAMNRATLRRAPPPGQATLDLRLDPVAPEGFAPRRDTLTALRGLPQPATTGPAPLAPPARRKALRVMLDPGHGGIDPGAQVGPLSEAQLMLTFAREVASALRSRGAEPMLTREDDRFIPLERRTTIARTAGAQLFVSLHADMLPQGQAAGATIYVWDPQSNDRAARELATRHDRDDLLAGTDLQGTDERVADVLMDLARTETQPRSQAFATHLSSEMALAGIGMHRRPVRGAAFSVLKSPDIPSVLLEVGFLSDPADRANLTDPAWRVRMADAISRAVISWSKDIAAQTPDRLR